MKLKQDLIIRQYFIDYSLGKYSENKQPTVPEYLVEELSKPNYEENLEITKLVVSETNVDASFKSSKVVANNQVYDFSKPNELDLFEAKYLDSATYPTVADIPMDIVDDLVLVEDLEGRKPVIFVSKDFKKLPVEDKFSQLIEIFKNRVRVDYSEPETILGQVFDLDKDSSWDEDLNQLVIVSAVLKGRICVVDDTRRYELKDSHIGKLTHANDNAPTPDYGNFKVKTTDGEILELDLTNVEQVTEWGDNGYIRVVEYNTGPGGLITQLKVDLSTVEEVISYGGPQIHTEKGISNISGYQLGTPNLIKIPDYLPEWVTIMTRFLSGATSFNQELNLDTSNVTSMSYFLYNASSFNQDLSHLCVPLIKSEPYEFATGATAYDKPRPIWGTCPGPKPFVLYRLYGEEVPVTEVREFQTKEDFFKEVALRSAFTHQDASQISYLKLGLVKSEYIEDGWLVAPMTSGKIREWQRDSAVGTFAPNAYLRIGELPDPKHPLLKDYNLVGVMFGGGAFTIQHDIVFPDWVITGESMFERARGIPEGSEHYSSDFRPFTLEDVDLSNLKSAPKMFKDFEDWGYSPSFYAELPFIPDPTRDVEVIENAKFYRRDYKGEEMTETIKPFSLMPKRNGHCEIGVDYEPYIALITSLETDEEHYIETIKEFETKEEFFNYTPLPGEERLVGLVKSEYIEDGWLLAPINDDPDTEIQFGSGYNPKLADYNLVGLMLARTNSRPYWSLPEWVITGESMFENKEDTEHHSYSLDGGGNIETIPKMFKNYKGVVDENGNSVDFSILVDSEEINAEEVNEGALVWSGMTPHSLEYRVTRTETESGKDRYRHQILIGPGGAR